MKTNVNCPICCKTLCKLEEKGKLENVYLYCKRCRKEIFLKEVPVSRK